MKKQYITFLYSIALAVFILPALTFAQSLPCNDIIDFNGDREPIEDCDLPFGPIADGLTLTLTINGEDVAPGDTIVVADPDTAELNFDFDGFGFSFPIMYKHDGDDYRAVGSRSTPTLEGFGTYSFVYIDEGPPILNQATPIQQLFDYLVPTVHAQAGPMIDPVAEIITFTIVEETVVEEIDPLLLQYAPILRMHEDEQYYPMRMEDFVTDSALWELNGSLNDSIVFNAETFTPEVFETFLENNTDTKDYYLAYSDPDNAKSIDLIAASTTYGNRDPEDVTIYVHRMNDSTGDREFIVLQYWQFYAMNNWQEAGELSDGEFTGFNNHEGDFESVFIFLDAETEEPEYVAYSAHHNNGEGSPDDLNVRTYDSVRRNWDDEKVTKDDEKIVSYVSLGSHANYPNNGNGGEHTVPVPFVDDNTDVTSENGEALHDMNTLINFNERFLEFEGKWGADIQDLTKFGGESGPQGPRFLEVGDTIRFLNPVEWAGIDRIVRLSLIEPTDSILFEAAQIDMQFTEPVAAGTEFEVTPYEEPITFGVVADNTELLPTYWDIESSLENDTFEVEVTFGFDPAIVEALEGDPNNLVVHFYNPDTDAWETRDSTVNTTENTVSFTSTTFSRYALGLVEPAEPKTLEELFDDLRTEIKSNDLKRWQEKRLLLRVNLAERFATKDNQRYDRIAKRLLNGIERIVNRYEKRGVINKQSKQDVFNLIENIKSDVI